MSYRCENCGEAQEVGTAPNKVVTHVRTSDYSQAWQIGKEINACVSCAAALEDKGPTASPISEKPGYAPLRQKLKDFRR